MFRAFSLDFQRMFTGCLPDVQRMFNVQLCLKHVRRCSPVVGERSAGLRCPFGAQGRCRSRLAASATCVGGERQHGAHRMPLLSG